MSEVEFDRLDDAAAPRRVRRPHAAGRLAVRALVERLDWVGLPVIYWTGTPEPTDDGSAAAVLQARLKALAAGPYAVRFTVPASPAVGTKSAGPPGTLVPAPAVAEVFPVDARLIAGALRRLAELRRFPALLSKRVGDVAAWRARCDAGLRRAREVLDAAADGHAQLSRACLILGSGEEWPLGGAKRSSVKGSGNRARPGRPPARSPDGPPRHACDVALARLLPGWPADVLHEAVRRVGPGALHRLARGSPEAAIRPDVAAAVRGRLLISPATTDDLLLELPALLALEARLADEPRRRLQAAVSIQHDALASAVADAGVGGNPIDGIDPVRPKRSLPLQLFRRAYEDRLAAAIDAYFGPVLARVPEPSHNSSPDGGRRRSAFDLVAVFRDLLAARPVCGALLGVPGLLRGRSPLVRWNRRDGRNGVMVWGHPDLVTYENLPEAAARVLWTLGQDRYCRPSRPPLMSLAAADAIGCPAGTSNWVETCVRIWPPGEAGEGHARAVLLALRAVHAHAAPNQRAAARTALDRFARPLLRRALAGVASKFASPGRDAQASLIDDVRFLCRALANRVSVDNLEAVLTDDHVDAFRAVLDHAPEQADAYLAFMRRWTEWLTRDAATPAARGRCLSDWNMVGRRSDDWADAFLGLGSELLGRLLDLMKPLAVPERECLHLIGGLANFALGDDYDARLAGSLPPSPALATARAAVGTALPSLRSVLRRRPVRDDPAAQSAALTLFLRCLQVAHAAAAGAPEGSAQARDILDACLTPLLRRRREPGTVIDDPGFFSYYTGKHLAALTAVALGRPERLLAIGTVVAGLQYPEIAQIADAWRFLERLSPLRELISSAAAREGRALRVLRLLARLGLCVRLRRHERLRAALGGLLARHEAVEAQAVIGPTASLSAGQADALRDLSNLRSGMGLPDRIGEILGRPQSLRAELAALEARPALADAARRRLDRLRELLADPQRLGDWVRRDLDKHLPAALDDARLARLEQIAESAVNAYFAEILTGGPPAVASDRGRRNWDNALRLYLSVDDNRPLLRRLLTHEARGDDRGWIVRQPKNADFLAGVRALGIDADAWLAPHAQAVDSPAGPCRIEVEADPLHVLQMGNYFDTCLSEGDMNAFSTIANALEANKRVVYAYGPRGNVIGRKLTVLTRRGRVLGFRTYGSLPQRAARGTEPGEGWKQLKDAMDAFCRDFAARCRASLHPYDGSTASPEQDELAGLALFAKWYNDGPEPFDRRWLAARRRGRSSPRSVAINRP